jgi:hypothetical protein
MVIRGMRRIWIGMEMGLDANDERPGSKR